MGLSLRTILLAACLVCSAVAPCRAVTAVLHTSSNGTSTVPVVSATGADIAVSTGTVALGYFQTLTDAQIESQHNNLTAADIAAIVGDFALFGAPVTGDVGDPAFNIQSFFEYTTGNENLSDLSNPFLGENIYTVIGLGNTGGGLADLQNATELLIYRHNRTFTAENPLPSIAPVNLSADFLAGNGTLLLGNFGIYQSDFGGAFPPLKNALSLEVITEPPLIPDPDAVDIRLFWAEGGGGGLELTWVEQAGFDHTVQMNDANLLPGGWIDLPFGPHTSPIVVSITEPADADEAYFRIVLTRQMMP